MSLIARALTGELSPDEQRAFEAHFKLIEKKRAAYLGVMEPVIVSYTPSRRLIPKEEVKNFRIVSMKP